MRRHGKPLAAAARPDIGIAAVALLARGGRVAGLAVDDGGVLAEEAHAHIAGGEAGDRHRTRRLLEELPLVDERAVGIGAQEILGENLVEAVHVALLHRADIIGVERRQRVEVGALDRICAHGLFSLAHRCSGGRSMMRRPAKTSSEWRGGDAVAGRTGGVISLDERSPLSSRTPHDRGRVMAKGQQRSNRKTKKPKKQNAEKGNKELSAY